MTDDELLEELLSHLGGASQRHWHRALAILTKRLEPCQVCAARQRVSWDVGRKGKLPTPAEPWTTIYTGKNREVL